MGFNKRKFWYFCKDYRRNIHIEVSGWNSHPSIYFRSDGGEGEIVFHLGFLFGIWICFSGFIPNKWYPHYTSKYGSGKIPEERQFYIGWHGGCFWWDFWVSEEKGSYSRNKTWRKGCWHIIDRLRGKHNYQKEEIERKQFVLPFLEGNYSVEVIKNQRIDSWPRWFTKKSIGFEVRAGYYKNGTWIDKPVPVEGKGESGWDCGEDATYSMSFPGHPFRNDLKSSYDAALYFWHSMMKSRERYGSAQWLPMEFKMGGLKTVV